MCFDIIVIRIRYVLKNFPQCFPWVKTFFFFHIFKESQGMIYLKPIQDSEKYRNN